MWRYVVSEDPTQDNRFGRSWQEDYHRPQRNAGRPVMPRWLIVLFVVAAIVVVLALIFPGLLPW